jgi:hypothetical protein
MGFGQCFDDPFKRFLQVQVDRMGFKHPFDRFQIAPVGVQAREFVIFDAAFDILRWVPLIAWAMKAMLGWQLRTIISIGCGMGFTDA